MIQKIQAYIKENHMLMKKDKVVVGVSGGADSVCLFFVLLECQKIYDLELIVVHINHGIRGKDADQDEKFVDNLAKKHGLKMESVFCDVRKLAKEKGYSEEEAGREARYQAFREVCERHQANKIAVAHHMDDQSETVLLHLFRGTGLTGLCGILPVRGNVIRPLLCVSRKEIEEFLEKRNQTYCQDSTNKEDTYTRNKVRLHLLPYISSEINEKAKEHIAQTALIMQENKDYIDRQIQKEYETCVKRNGQEYFLHENLFSKQHIIIQKGIINEIFKNLAGGLKDIESIHIHMILELMNKEVGKQVDLPYELKAFRTYDGVTIRKKSEDRLDSQTDILTPVEINPPCKITFEKNFFVWNREEKDKYINVGFEILSENVYENTAVPKKDYTKWFDYDKIENAVFIRNQRNGDYIQIDSSGSIKKLNRYFIDRKIPSRQRGQIPLLTDGNHVMWVIGDRISEKYKVSEQTKRILQVTVLMGYDR